MNLIEQVISIIFSGLYGYIAYILYKICKKYLYTNKKMYSFLNSFLFVINLVLMYFIIFLKINNGDIIIVFILITLCIFLVLNYSNLQKKCKKKAN